MPRPILVSACLLGLLTRYDGTSKRNKKVLDYLRRNDLVPVPVCPEQLAGLPTPRPATRFTAGDGAAVLDGTGSVRNAEGAEVNELFLRGAAETLKAARLAGCREALLKERSPSCGVHQVYLEQDVVAGRGVTAALLARHGIRVFGEEDL
jgi:uncharacterized protein YbbK (DUF523 family)